MYVAGCTTKVPIEVTITPEVSQANPDSASYASDLNKNYTPEAHTIVTPFKKSTNQYGHLVYAGVVDDNKELTYTPGRHTVTYEFIKTKDETTQRFKQIHTDMANQGYRVTPNSEQEVISTNYNNNTTVSLVRWDKRTGDYFIIEVEEMVVLW